jgi:hypothetical protein
VEISEINQVKRWGVKRMEPSVIAQRYSYVKAHAELVVDTSPFCLRSRLFGNVVSRDKDPLV